MTLQNPPFTPPHQDKPAIVVSNRLMSSAALSTPGSIRKRPLGWQETGHAGLGSDDVIQYWFSDIALDADLATSRRDHRDGSDGISARHRVAVEPLLPRRPLRRPSADPGQVERQGRVGLRLYSPKTVAESFDWEPTARARSGAQVAGVEAAIWAETISNFDDLCFLLLPRLAGIAQKAWSDPRSATWTDHRDRLARHGRLWADFVAKVTQQRPRLRPDSPRMRPHFS
jgi:hexosaminidase